PVHPVHPVYPHLENYENIVVLRNGPDNPPDTDGWHTDVTYNENPPFASFLVAREVPECGGDTLGYR
ncbi:MAG: taurine dioxygenase, partial [Gammaproteobacteria bacterium]